MAIDTTTKKLSLFDLGCPWRRSLPVGDGSFSTGDKQHFLFLYSGIDATSVVSVISPIGVVAGSVFLPGVQKGSLFTPGAPRQKMGSNFLPGVQKGKTTGR